MEFSTSGCPTRNWRQGRRNGNRARLTISPARSGNMRKRSARRVTAPSPIRAERVKHTAMRISELVRLAALSAVVAASSLVAAGSAYAFDDKVFDDKSSTGKNSNPWTVFRFGFSAYKNGHKDQAVEAYRYAAENGQLGATWKLARMYAEGDGVARNDYEAFKFFNEIAQQDVEPGSPEESYVSDAL